MPSQMANSETSGPSRYSSTTTRSHARRVRQRRRRGRSVTMTPLPAARPSSLTTYGDPSSSSAAATSSGVVQSRAAAVGTPAACITSLAKAFEPSSWAAASVGPKQAIPAARDGVGDAGDQRRLGPDDHEVGPEVARERGDRLAGHRVDVVQGRDGRDARVPRGGVHLVDRRVAGQGEGEGVLAPAGSDDERLHVAGL